MFIERAQCDINIISDAGDEPKVMRLTIFQRLTAGYLAIMFMVLSFGGYTAFQLNQLTRITHLAAGVDSDVILMAESLSTGLYGLVALEKKYWISRDKDFYALFLKRRQEFLKQLEKLSALLSETESKRFLQHAQELSQKYFKRVDILATRSDAAPSAGYVSERDKRIHKITASLNQIFLAGNKARNEKIRQSQTISARIFRLTVGFAAACILAGLVISLLTTRRIVRPILALQRTTREIAAGRFVTVEVMRAPPEIRNLAEDFNVMSERLKALDELKEDFVSHVSHDLRTPLTAIWEASEMLIAGTFQDDPESSRRLLTIVRDECKRLIVSVNRILDLSRMESGMMDYEFEEIDLNDVIQSTVFKLSPIAQARKIRLHFNPRPNLPPVVADAEKLNQLLENLIGNALKFTDSEGSVALEILVSESGRDNILVSVADTGCGIDPEHLESIFEKFRSIEKGKDIPRGSGLGLAIAKHIVTAHGGTIWVESKKGTGSTFYFSLPHA